jgi:hypothetical protein
MAAIIKAINDPAPIVGRFMAKIASFFSPIYDQYQLGGKGKEAAHSQQKNLSI